eukprot:gene6096-2693_t
MAATLTLDRTNDFTQGYADACIEVAQELEVPVVDLWRSMQNVEMVDRTNDFTQGVRGEGHVVDLRTLMQKVEDLGPKLLSEALPMHFPAWDEIDPNDPASSFVVKT